MAILKGNQSDDLTLKYLLQNVGGGGGSQADIDALKQIVGNTPLTTTAQNLTDAVNELDGDIGSINTEIGSTALPTTAQTLTGAIAEIHTDIGNDVLYLTGVSCSAMTGDFVSVSNASITADHVVAECVFASPSAITSNVTWTTASGSLKLNGTCASATTCSIVLVKKDN